MNLATSLRYMNTKEGNVWNNRQFIVFGYHQMAYKYKIGLNAIMTEYGYEDICEKCDGFILPGSGNLLNPAYYGQPEWETPCIVDEYALDSKLLDYFISRDKPVFGICWGLQAINVFFGGTLTKIPDPEEHQNHEEHKHIIEIKEGSFVHDVFGCTEREINSYHGRCIDKLAPCLEAVAWTKDGVIEAIQSKDKKIFATQWHPELSFDAYVDAEENKFIENFINLCRR